MISFDLCHRFASGGIGTRGLVVAPAAFFPRCGAGFHVHGFFVDDVCIRESVPVHPNHVMQERVIVEPAAASDRLGSPRGRAAQPCRTRGLTEAALAPGVDAKCRQHTHPSMHSTRGLMVSGGCGAAVRLSGASCQVGSDRFRQLGSSGLHVRTVGRPDGTRTAVSTMNGVGMRVGRMRPGRAERARGLVSRSGRGNRDRADGYWDDLEGQRECADSAGPGGRLVSTGKSGCTGRRGGCGSGRPWVRSFSVVCFGW